MMIGLAMEKWPDEALRRVVDAPVERWRPEWYAYEDGSACLVGHAGDLRRFRCEHGEGPGMLGQVRLGPGVWDAAEELRGNLHITPEGRFDALCDRFGIPRTVRAIKARALEILLRRHPIDSRLAVLRAGLKTGV